MGEPLPLATIQDAILAFLRGRRDAVLFGAQAVNAYVDESRMTQDVDILSPRPTELAEELRAFLAERFSIETNVRVLGDGSRCRVYQERHAGRRLLATVRLVNSLPQTQCIEDVHVASPDELLAGIVSDYRRRKGTPSSGLDRRDIAVLFLTFPHLKDAQGPVRERLLASGADAETLATWEALAAEEIRAEEDDDEFR